MAADPTLVAALSQDGAWPFLAVRMALPGKTLRLLDGSATIVINGETYEGGDAEFGSIAVMEQIGGGGDGEAPEISILLSPPDTTAAVTLASPIMQGSVVSIMLGVVNPATMALIGTPEVIFLGEVDVPTLNLGEGTRTVEFTIVSVFERLFEVDEGARASSGFHQSIWPGETGLAEMTGTVEKLYWGSKPPAGSLGYQGGIFSGGFAAGHSGRAYE